MKMMKLRPTLLGKIVNRYGLDPYTANTIINLLGTSPNLEIENVELFLKEVRLYLIARDNDESLYQLTDYEVSSGEAKLLEKYKEGSKDLPTIDKIRSLWYEDKDKRLREYEDKIKNIL